MRAVDNQQKHPGSNNQKNQELQPGTFFQNTGTCASYTLSNG
jgi:hypothetical protein